MFRKPFKLKFQIQLKSTEKKKFCNDLKVLYPALRDEDISSLVSNKENILKTKITTFKDEDVEIYCINKIPMYIDIIDSDIKLPTVYMVWRFPHILPVFTTNSSVLTKLKNGADLFFPGIYTEGLFFCELDYKKNDSVGINLVDNKATVAIGISLVDKDDIMDGNKNKNLGRIVKIYHTVGDCLFKMNSDAVVVQLGPPDWALPVNEESQLDDGVIKNLNKSTDGLNNVEKVTEEVKQLEVKEVDSTTPNDMSETGEVNSVDSEKEKANELLEYCLLKALKTTPKTSYPILPATFYANHVLTSVPEGQNLNIKKTKWKKFSAFLQEKSLEGLINLQQMPKNEFTIAGVNLDNKRIKEFVDPYKTERVLVESKGNKPTVQQVYSVSANTLPFFAKFGLKKHDELTRNDVRNHLNDYIKSENLANPEKLDMVVLDPILYRILKGEEVISRSNLLQGILDKMSVQHKVSNCENGDPILHKGKMPLIQFETCMKMGNKKVTLISNLESYGVNPANFSKELQRKAAASTTVIPVVPGKKGPQIQVQGNQIAVAVGILKEKYNINEKFMRGLEKAVKSKNKKN